ncbi:Nse1 non-SMC component of SMC5-6 complex-domain-containing protein [Massariosphaeria phaeospora]|uniref:Non-structural maintenance of chromosomes element 1 homolog n=1 Tax=Massariosphaeria phaeospora TaxID=100035 RepID=A0A7C8M293_9PLEO|nr:Nse1 non-SMC component of SMC5-6 complex-domain-containing protein [Massariosphaeria phaeospora]
MPRESSTCAESPSDADVYNYAHRAFLQAFLSQSVMTVDEIKPVLAAVLTAHDPTRPSLEGDITQPLITSTVQAINAKIGALDYEIRSARDQTSKTLTYALVNTTSDALTQLATSFTPDEISYVKRLLDYMFETNNTRIREIMAVSTMETTQIARPPPRSRQSQAQTQIEADGDEPTQVQVRDPGLKMQEAEDVLNTLVAQGFFHCSRAGYYSLAPRALMELRAYLKETYNEPPADDDPEDEGITRIHDCEGCREIVTVGVRCSDRDCGVRWHDRCAIQYFRGPRGDTKKCPTCKTGWTGDLFVGERAANTQRRSTGGRNSRRNEEDYEDE